MVKLQYSFEKLVRTPEGKAQLWECEGDVSEVSTTANLSRGAGSQ
jgi:hypothetical protein